MGSSVLFSHLQHGSSETLQADNLQEQVFKLLCFFPSSQIHCMYPHVTNY